MSINFDEFKNDVLSSSAPISQEEIETNIQKINENAHKSELFSEQIKSYITDIPIFSIQTSKLFAIKYLEEYHKWLLENFDIKPKN